MEKLALFKRKIRTEQEEKLVLMFDDFLRLRLFVVKYVVAGGDSAHVRCKGGGAN